MTITPSGDGVYALSPFPFAAEGAEFAFPGRPIEPRQHERDGGWATALAKTPSEWERFKLVAG